MQDKDENIIQARKFKKWGVEYRQNTGPPENADRPVCTRSEFCEGCPFPGHGFLCWGDDGDCMRKRVEKLSEVKHE